MDWPSLALPVTIIVWASMSESVRVRQRDFSKMSVPISSRVFVPPLMVFPLIRTTSVFPEYRLAHHHAAADGPSHGQESNSHLRG